MQVYENVIQFVYFLKTNICCVRCLQLVIVFLVVTDFSLVIWLGIVRFISRFWILAKGYEVVDELEVLKFQFAKFSQLIRRYSPAVLLFKLIHSYLNSQKLLWIKFIVMGKFENI